MSDHHEVRFTANDYAVTWRIEVDDERNIVRVLGHWGVDPNYQPEGPSNPFVPATADDDTLVRTQYADRIRRGYA
jgi:hypothetical protein